MTQNIYYAIGDIHGEIDKLLWLHDQILLSHDTDFPNIDYTIIHLGDYVDRGKFSFEVIELLMRMDADEKNNVICLKGNHEQMMIEAFKGNDQYAPGIWGKYGGKETMKSYRRHGFEAPPQYHLDWMENLPSFYWDKNAKIIFVHAGIDPVYFPNDGEDTHLWTRSKSFFNTAGWDNAILEDVKIVHGHTPTKTGQPEFDSDCKRINIDTGACYGGPLTAAVLAPGATPKFISV